MMAMSSGSGFDAGFDIKQILLRAERGWLLSAEIYHILQNYESLRSHISISDRPPDRPPSGSVFLFNRLRLKHFREDGHNWRKKKDGKTVSESHENLQVSSSVALKCYYARGKENENFRRRIYWMLDGDSHIVLVHYLEIKKRTRDVHDISDSEGVGEDERGRGDDGISDSQGIGEGASNPTDGPTPPEFPFNYLPEPKFEYLDPVSPSDGLEEHPQPNRETVGSGDGNSFCICTQDSIYPSLSDQHFTISDFSPNWAYTGSETKVIIRGKFCGPEDVRSIGWACMFGEKQVPAEVGEDGVLRCHTPLHEKAGSVSFYVTRSDRLACSEVREFEFWNSSLRDVHLYQRLVKLLCTSQTFDPSSSAEKSQLYANIDAALKDDPEWEQMLRPCYGGDKFSVDEVNNQVAQKHLKEKLPQWLIQKIIEGGEGPNMLDEGGQGVLHFAAALGYDWAIEPTKVAGVSMNFRDANGWTALHWAAYNGRERTVRSLISRGANPELSTHPTPTYDSGRTPADLASSNGYGEIADYLRKPAIGFYPFARSMRDFVDSAGEIGSNQIATPKFRRGSMQPMYRARILNEHVLSLGALETRRAAGQQARKNHGKIWFDGLLDKIISWWRTGTCCRLWHGRYRTEDKKCDKVLNSAESGFHEDLIDLDASLEDDTFMPTASWAYPCRPILHSFYCTIGKIKVGICSSW